MANILGRRKEKTDREKDRLLGNKNTILESFAKSWLICFKGARLKSFSSPLGLVAAAMG